MADMFDLKVRDGQDRLTCRVGILTLCGFLLISLTCNAKILTSEYKWNEPLKKDS